MHRTALASVLLTFCSLLGAQVQTVGVWTHPNQPAPPPGRQSPKLAFDVARGVLVMTGCPPYSGMDTNTYEWNGASWRTVAPAHPVVGNNYDARLCYSPLRGRVVAVRSPTGISPTPVQTYEWNGNDWVLLSAAGAPPSRSSYFQLCWDETRNVLVLFGGGTSFADTWEWDGTTWTQRGTGGPPGRERACMAYDVSRQRTVLYGGIPVNTGGNFTDTWEWDGQVWRERFGMAPPPLQGLGSGMAYDRRRQRMVLFGGVTRTTPTGNSNAVYEYDGTAWTQLTCLGSPPGVFDTALAYDARRDRLVAYGGSYANSQLDAWELEVRTGFVASFGPHGAGCAGSAGVPTLAAVNGTRPQLGASLQLQYANLPNTPLALVFSVLGFDDQLWNSTPLPLDLAPLGMPGCMLRLWPDVITPLANVNGIATMTLAVPANPVLDGLPFFAQGAVLSSGTNPAGLIVSDSGRGVLGAL